MGGGSARGQAGDEAQVTFIDGALSNGTWHSEHLFSARFVARIDACTYPACPPQPLHDT